jgi:hypothetical protein
MIFRIALNEPSQSPIDIYRHRPQRQTQTEKQTRPRKRERPSEHRFVGNVVQAASAQRGSGGKWSPAETAAPKLPRHRHARWRNEPGSHPRT